MATVKVQIIFEGVKDEDVEKVKKLMKNHTELPLDTISHLYTVDIFYVDDIE